MFEDKIHRIPTTVADLSYPRSLTLGEGLRNTAELRDFGIVYTNSHHQLISNAKENGFLKEECCEKNYHP